MAFVQHIALNCRDMRQQERFYSEHFGFRRARVFHPGSPAEFVMLRLGTVCLELFSACDAPCGCTGNTGGEQTVGFKHLAFQVDDLDGTVARLVAAGVSSDPVINCQAMAAGLRVCFLRDPDGNILELMEGYTDDPDVPPMEDEA